VPCPTRSLDSEELTRELWVASATPRRRRGQKFLFPLRFAKIMPRHQGADERAGHRICDDTATMERSGRGCPQSPSSNNDGIFRFWSSSQHFPASARLLRPGAS
jgi:hypothetical protein